MPRITKKRNYRKRVTKKNSYRKRRVHIGGSSLVQGIKGFNKTTLKNTPSVSSISVSTETGANSNKLQKELRNALQKRGGPRGSTSVVRNKSTRQSITASSTNNEPDWLKKVRANKKAQENKQRDEQKQANPKHWKPRTSKSEYKFKRTITPGATIQNELTKRFGTKSTKQNTKPQPGKLKGNFPVLKGLFANRQSAPSPAIPRQALRSSQRPQPRKRPCHSYGNKDMCERNGCIFDNGKCKKK